MRKAVMIVAAAVLLSRCALYNEVSIGPHVLLPSSIERGADLQAMLRKADYLRAIETAPAVQSRARRSATDLAALGNAYLACGRLDDARGRLRDALDLEPFRTVYADIAWSLSQVEYLANNYDASLEWALLANDRGLQVRQWHIDYLRAMGNIPIYRFSGTPNARLPFKFGHPDVPRLNVRINDHDVEGILDSGAVLSIVSTRMAEKLGVKAVNKLEGTFYGLLGEPIAVRFGIVDRLELGSMIIENVPVAIMPDAKMRFLISKREGTEFNMDFLLGSNLLKEFRLELDFARNDIVFNHLTDRDRKPHSDQNLFFEGFRPHVRGSVNRKGWFLFVLDTGSEITFLNETRLGSLPLAPFVSGGHTATLQGLGGAMKQGAKVENVEIGIDEWAGTFKTLPMYSTEGKEFAVGILGQNFLKNFNVVIDFGRMRVDLKRR